MFAYYHYNTWQMFNTRIRTNPKEKYAQARGNTLNYLIYRIVGMCWNQTSQIANQAMPLTRGGIEPPLSFDVLHGS